MRNKKRKWKNKHLNSLMADMGSPELDIKATLEEFKVSQNKRTRMCVQCGVTLSKNQKSMYCTECLIEVYEL